MNRNQVSRKGFARQQNNSLFFKDSKSCLGCPDMRTLLDASPVGKIYTYSEDTPDRVPMIAESTIIFDKTGYLTKLRKSAQKIKPRKAKRENYQFIQFMIYHANNKVERYLDNDPPSALLSMGININDILKNHYKIQGKWWVSNKRLLSDLNKWDTKLANLLEKFILTNEVKPKFAVWSEIIDYVLKPIGGRQPISENNCDCEICNEDLRHFN